MVGGQVLSGVHGRRRRGVVGIPPKQVYMLCPSAPFFEREGGESMKTGVVRRRRRRFGGTQCARTQSAEKLELEEQQRESENPSSGPRAGRNAVQSSCGNSAVES